MTSGECRGSFAVFYKMVCRSGRMQILHRFCSSVAEGSNYELSPLTSLQYLYCMKRALIVSLACLLLANCSLETAKPNAQELSSSAIHAVETTNVRCTTWRNDGTLNKWEASLKAALQVSTIYSIGGMCEMSDGTHWISVVPGGVGDEVFGQAIIVHLDTQGSLLRQLDGYATYEGDIAACGLEKVIGSRLIVTCSSGVNDEIIALNTNTDERVTLYTSDYGASYGAALQDSPFQGFTCPENNDQTCTSKISTEKWGSLLASTLKKQNISIGDTCDLSASESVIAYAYPYSDKNQRNGIALIGTNGKLIASAEDSDYPALTPPHFSCRSGSTIAFRFEMGNTTTSESHRQLFVAGSTEQKADLIDALHETRNLNPCDSEGCFTY